MQTNYQKLTTSIYSWQTYSRDLTSKPKSTILEIVSHPHILIVYQYEFEVNSSSCFMSLLFFKKRVNVCQFLENKCKIHVNIFVLQFLYFNTIFVQLKLSLKSSKHSLRPLFYCVLQKSTKMKMNLECFFNTKGPIQISSSTSTTIKA